jgi:MYXO-CTERM domain-containing protein
MNHRISCLSAALAATVTLQATTSEAIVVARVTRRGYIVVDDVGDWGNAVPQESSQERARFIGSTTAALSELPDFTPGKFLAVMQIPSTQNPLAYYLPIRNDVRGIGQRSPLDARSEVFDTNSFYNTTFPLDGFVYLNSYRFYTDPRALIYGRFLICTQEFGHRFSTQVSILPNPQGTGDSGVVPVDAAADASTDVAVSDVAGDVAGDVADVPVGPPPLARDALLGRGNVNSAGVVVNRAHWSYFFNSGGSPMEGNLWTEFSPGMFRTERPTFRFSPFDLYLMGLIPASQVPPTFVIAEPTNLPRGVSRDSPPEYYSRQVTIRGRRVDVSIEDLQRANGPRNPAYSSVNHDLDVMWVLLADEADVNDQLAAEFDEAIDSCAMGYTFATGERGRLRAIVPPQPDADVPADASADAALEDAAPARDADPLPDVPTIPAPDGMVNPDGGAVAPPPVPLHAEGGCQCDVPAAPTPRVGPWAALALGLVAFSRRKKRAR